MKGVTGFDIMLLEKDTINGPADQLIGSIVGLKSELSAVIYLNSREYSFVSMLASANRQCYLDLRFDKPRYQSALIRGVSISTRAPDE